MGPGNQDFVQLIIMIIAVVAGVIRGHWEVKEVNARCTRHKAEIEKLNAVIAGLEKDLYGLFVEAWEGLPEEEPKEEIDRGNAPPF